MQVRIEFTSDFNTLLKSTDLYFECELDVVPQIGDWIELEEILENARSNITEDESRRFLLVLMEYNPIVVKHRSISYSHKGGLRFEAFTQLLLDLEK